MPSMAETRESVEPGSDDAQGVLGPMMSKGSQGHKRGQWGDLTAQSQGTKGTEQTGVEGGDGKSAAQARTFVGG